MSGQPWFGEPGLWQRRAVARLALFGAALAFASTAAAQELDEAKLLIISRSAFFHVTAEGAASPVQLGACGSPPAANGRRTCQGKGFAIGPQLLLTARHLVGDDQDWLPKGGVNLEIARAARPLDRSVALRRAAGAPALSGLTNSIVLPTPGGGADIAGLSLPSRAKLDTFFGLSVCGIVEGGTYFAVMTENGQPDDPASIDEPIVVPLKAAGYDAANYGPLYVFESIGSPRFHGEMDGHDGSPVVDKDGNAVAIVSAVTATGGAGTHRILATPIQPLSPGATAMLAQSDEKGSQLKCSLADTVGQIRNDVRQIKDEVAAQAIWTVKVEREKVTGKLETIRLSYDNVGREPNIESIEIYYEFHGIHPDLAPSVERINYPNDPHGNILTNVSRGDEDSEFWTSEIGRIGRETVEPFVKQTAPQKGVVRFVRISIYPILKGGRRVEWPTTRRIEWVEAQ